MSDGFATNLSPIISSGYIGVALEIIGALITTLEPNFTGLECIRQPLLPGFCD